MNCVCWQCGQMCLRSCPEVVLCGWFSWLIYTWVLCAFAPPDSNLISVPQSCQPPSLHPLLHLISSSPSIQIVFIGMTGPVVGDSHRHGRTMHCDGDIHMIMPSDLTLLQIHLDSQSPFSLSSPLSVSLSVWMYMTVC